MHEYLESVHKVKCWPSITPPTIVPHPGPCQDGSLRLVNGYYGTVGAVEICLEGRWRGLCGETWDNKDASVVCRQLGFSPFGLY